LVGRRSVVDETLFHAQVMAPGWIR
jgi:hypothetical protein